MFLYIYTDAREELPISRFDIPSGFIPRVGESITLKSPLESPTTRYESGVTLLVRDVSYELDDEGITPHVHCFPARKNLSLRASRRRVLKRHGWLEVD